MTSIAFFRPRYGKFDFFAEGGFFKGNLQIVAQIRPPLRPLSTLTSSAAAKESIKDIIKAAAEPAAAKSTESAEPASTCACAARFKGGVTKLIVLLTLLRIGENAISLVDLFEFLLGRFGIICASSPLRSGR